MANKATRMPVPLDRKGLASPLGRGGTMSAEPPNMQTALARRSKGEEELYDKDSTIAGPLGRTGKKRR